MKAKVADRGQVTIPKALRERLGIRPGTVLDFHEEAGQLIAQKSVSGDPDDQIFGALGTGRSTDELVDELRGDR